MSTSGRTRFELLSAQARRRLTALTLLRSLVNFAMVIMLYALSPLHGSGGARTLLYFLLGVALFVSILFWQLQRIARADHPQLVALQAVGLAIALILTVFAVVYILMSNSNPAAFSEDLTKSSSLYFAVTVLSTVGFGDIVPRTDPARLVVTEPDGHRPRPARCDRTGAVQCGPERGRPSAGGTCCGGRRRCRHRRPCACAAFGLTRADWAGNPAVVESLRLSTEQHR